MSWFDSKSFASLAKDFVKKIDKVLDIQEDESQVVDVNVAGDKDNKTDDLLAGVNVDSGEKRQSVATTASVDVLTPSPCTDQDISESVELITITSEFTSDSEAAAVESMVIIGEKETEMKKLEESFPTKEDSTKSAVDENETKQTVLQSADEIPYELQAIDSDSTQSFEDIQMQSTRSTESNTDISKLNKQTAHKTTSSKSDTPSAHTSNDEMDTTTSSDIEIISNPNGDGSDASTTTRTSPMKKAEQKMDLASNQLPINTTESGPRKGHCREPSEISILSIDSPSEDEVEKLLKRVSELNNIVEARELRLLQSEQNNSELQERVNELQALVNAGNLQPEEYTKRMSSLEKKFQSCIRERDTLRSEMKDLRTKIPKNDLTNALEESQCMVNELRLEGEKLAKEVLQQSNIIKKLRSKEKTTDAQLKSLRDQLASTSEEVERLKKTLSAKDDVERTQIEAVHKMSSENQRLDKDNALLRGKLDDTQQKFNTLQHSFDAIKTELQQRSKQHSDLSRTAESVQTAEREKIHAQAESNELQRQIQELREKLRLSENSAMKREQQLREENRNLLSRLEDAELRAESSTQEISQTTIPLMRHLESLQHTLNQRTTNWNKEEKSLLDKLETSQSRLKSLEHIEQTTKAKIEELKLQCQELEEKLSRVVLQEEKTKIALQLELKQKETDSNRQLSELFKELEQKELKIKTLEDSQLVLQQCLKDSEDKMTSSVECIQRDQLTNSLTEFQQSVTDARPHSPVNSLEDGNSFDWQQDDLDCVSNSGRPPLVPGIGFYVSHNSTNFEYLQSTLKQKDGEMAQCQWELSRLQAERNVLQEELSQVSMEIENLKEKMQSYEMVETNYSDLQTRYDALLQMYGEKVERCEELELDLKECKDAYKIQIQELLAKPQT